MDVRLCGECRNHYVKGGWHCWSGNKSLGFCHWNSTPHPKAKHWKYIRNVGKRLHNKLVNYEEIRRVDNETD
jgi:hypothetical protein